MKQTRRIGLIILIFGLLAIVMAGCTPTADPVSVTRPTATETVETAENGWCIGGPELFTAADIGCYLESVDSGQVRSLNDEIVFIFAEPELIDNWAGAAVIFHKPTKSMLVLDKFGDIDPLTSYFSSRIGLAALDEVSGDVNLMAGLKEQVQERNQTSPSKQPEVRLGVAWQDGSTTIFLVAVAGLTAEDDRFYCSSQTWTIGEETIAIEASCLTRDPEVPIRRHFFETHTINGNAERSVQLALDGVASNIVQVSEKGVAEETAIYLAALEQVTNRSLLVRAETATGFENDLSQLLGEVDPTLLENFQVTNETGGSLRFLFQISSAYFVHPGAAIDLNFLTPGSPQQVCEAFRTDYPGLGGIITLSGIGFNEDGSDALVYVRKECGTSIRSAAYYLLGKTADGWQVTNTIEAAVELPLIIPELVYDNQAAGCGDIFVYKSNGTMSEFLTVYIDALAFHLTTDPLTLALADYPDEIWVRIDGYSGSVDKLGENPYCNDVGPTAEVQSIWKAVSGSLTVSVTAESISKPCEHEPYQATILLEDVIFALGEETINLPPILFDSVQVGWCPG